MSILHNTVHLPFGVAFMLMARTLSAARLYLIGGGFLYLALLGYGLLIDQNSAANVIPVHNSEQQPVYAPGCRDGCPRCSAGPAGTHCQHNPMADDDQRFIAPRAKST